MDISGTGKASFTSTEVYLNSLTESQLYALEHAQKYYRLEEERALQLFKLIFEDYEDLIQQIPKDDQKQHEFLFVLLSLAFNRVAIGDRIIYFLITALDKDELLYELGALHKLCKGLLEDTLTPLTGLPPILKQLRERESDGFLKLMNELRVLIQTEGKQCISQQYRKYLRYIPSYEPVQGLTGINKKASSTGSLAVGDEGEDDLELKEKEVFILFSERARSELEKVLLPYVKKESQEPLSFLIAGEPIKELIYFNGTLSQLTEIFKDLKATKIYEYKKAIDIGRWLEAYFMYYNQKDKKFVNVKEPSATRSLREKYRVSRQLK